MEVDKIDHEIEEELVEKEEEEEEEVYYTPGPKELYDVRLKILNYSLKQSANRLQKLRQLKQSATTTTITTTKTSTTTTTKIPSQDEINILKSRRQLNSNLSKYEIYGSQFIPGNTRTISNIKISNNDKYIACGSWDGSINILNNQDLSIFKTTTSSLSQISHTEKVSGLSWNNDSSRLVSGGNEGMINIWDVNDNSDDDDNLLSSIVSIKSAHNDRITKTMFHPIDNLIISTSFDQTWKLWDLNKLSPPQQQHDPPQCLMEQEGHSKPVFTGSIHPDGGLFMSGGLDGIVHIWDLRSGRSIVTLQKHMAGIYCLDWSPNGYQFVTGSGDCSLKIWDLRKLGNNNNELYSIPAHTKLITDVKFYHQGKDVIQKQKQQDQILGPEFNNGKFLVSCSYDGDVNIWSSDNWIKIKSLRGHTDKVMSCDINNTGEWIVSSGWDRSIKLWKQ